MAFMAIRDRSFGDRLPDIDINMGITPSGFIKLKKEVKTITLNSNIPMVEAKILVGKVRAILQKAEGLKYNFTSQVLSN